MFICCFLCFSHIFVFFCTLKVCKLWQRRSANPRSEPLFNISLHVCVSEAQPSDWGTRVLQLFLKIYIISWFLDATFQKRFEFPASDRGNDCGVIDCTRTGQPSVHTTDILDMSMRHYMYVECVLNCPPHTHTRARVFSCCTLDLSLTFPPLLFPPSNATKCPDGRGRDLVQTRCRSSSLCTEVIWAPAPWKAVLKLGLLWHLSFILPTFLSTSTKAESHFYQILEGTKAFINVITESSLDSVVSLPLNLFVMYATRTDWRPFLCCAFCFECQWPAQPTLISACWPLLSTLRRARSDLGAPQVVAARRASTAHISARKFQACTK